MKLINMFASSNIVRLLLASGLFLACTRRSLADQSGASSAHGTGTWNQESVTAMSTASGPQYSLVLHTRILIIDSKDTLQEWKTKLEARDYVSIGKMIASLAKKGGDIKVRNPVLPSAVTDALNALSEEYEKIASGGPVPSWTIRAYFDYSDASSGGSSGSTRGSYVEFEYKLALKNLTEFGDIDSFLNGDVTQPTELASINDDAVLTILGLKTLER